MLKYINFQVDFGTHHGTDETHELAKIFDQHSGFPR